MLKRNLGLERILIVDWVIILFFDLILERKFSMILIDFKQLIFKFTNDVKI